MHIKKSFITTLCFILILSLFVTPVNRAASRAPVRGKNGMVASVSEITSQVGVDIMKRGGNAVDAAVAVGLALAVVWPEAGNLGGGGFMLIRRADGKAVAIDYREMAPAKAHRNIYLDAKGDYIKDSSVVGYKAAGVPGTVAGMAHALEKYGTMKWADVCEPARRLAAGGFTVSYPLETSIKNSSDKLTLFPESKRIYLRDGKPYEEGEKFVQPELAATFDRMIKNGPREFYEGETARLIADSMKKNADGWMTMEDLKNYQVKEREPLRAMYRGNEIITMPPPSSGGIALIEMLNMLGRYDLASMGFNSSRELHVKVEAMRRAFADRSEYLGDTDFVKVPVAGLVEKSYADKQAASINLARASTSAKIKQGKPTGYESTETTHFTVIDKDGNVATNTYTLNGSFGSYATVEGAGFLLNNEMDDFAAKPGTANMYGLLQSEKNAVAARKRPLSAMTPTIVLKDGKVWFALGSPGGPTIINTVLQTIINVIDHGMTMQEAVDAPRIHHQWMPDQIVYEPGGIVADVKDKLSTMGHQFTDKPRRMGDCEAIMIDPKTGVRLGASDPRRGGKAVGY